jgi:hypothetical protein
VSAGIQALAGAGTIGKDRRLPGGRWRLQWALRIEKNRSMHRAQPPTIPIPTAVVITQRGRTSGERDVTSAFFEISAPVLKQLELMASGRYDDYSTSNRLLAEVRPKVTPIEMIACAALTRKASVSSFNEGSGLTTGYVTASCRTASRCAGYLQPSCARRQSIRRKVRYGFDADRQ